MRKHQIFLSLTVLFTLFSGTVFAEGNSPVSPVSPLLTGPCGSDADHKWDDGLTSAAPTCTEDGIVVYTCTVCGETKTETLSALGHNWNQGVITKRPDCTSAGQLQYTCLRCKETTTQAIAKLGHSWDDGVVTNAATCTSVGTILYTCSRCNRTRTDATPTLSHKWVQNSVIHPNCTADGSSRKSCSLCGKILEEALPATGHSWDNGEITTAPTRFHQGCMTYTCTSCGDTYEEILSVIDGGNPFVDVSEDAFYANPVLWALDRGITTGTDDVHFEPERSCTRGEVITFLWRAAGSPESSHGDCPFVDVNANQYYYDAILWGIENGIVKGLDETHYGPDDSCTRAQVVTFLWRSAGSPEAKAESAFTDVLSVRYALTAITWAAENKITTGVGGSCFAPDDSCSRGQIVTFLYRAATQ